MRYFIIGLALIPLTSAFGCTTAGTPGSQTKPGNKAFRHDTREEIEKLVDQLDDENMAAALLKQFEKDDSLPPGHVLGDLLLEKSKMPETDKDFLHKRCVGCHDLNYLFLNRSPLSEWKKTMYNPHHADIELKKDELDRLFKILERYFNKL